jgi:hypothetical protein
VLVGCLPCACASGIRPLGAGTSLLIGCGCWLHREDFTRRSVITGTSVSDGTAMVSIDREAAVGALEVSIQGCSRLAVQAAVSMAGSGSHGLPLRAMVTASSAVRPRDAAESR